jgi:hypothetical protein
MKFLPALGLGLSTCLTLFNSAEVFAATLNWAGQGGYYLTGSFTASDIDNDGFIRANNANPSEITTINISFFKPDNSLLATYNTAEIKADPNFNFNYIIVPNLIFQNGAFDTPNGFSLGNSVNGYSLDTFDGTRLSFTDFNLVSDFDQGGVLTATIETVVVPFGFSPHSSLAVFGTIWFGYNLKKKLKK